MIACKKVQIQNKITIIPTKRPKKVD
jgi:hypothetical protein